MISNEQRQRIERDAEAKVKEAAASLTVLQQEQWRMFVDGYLQGYTEAAETWVERSAGEWVRASERVPEDHSANFHWRLIHNQRPVSPCWHISLGRLIVEYSNLRTTYSFDEIEWLDPSPTERAQDGGEIKKLKQENDKMRKTLKSILQRCATSGEDYGQAIYDITEASYEAIRIDSP